MQQYSRAIKVFNDILKYYPNTLKNDLILLKINYAKLLKEVGNMDQNRQSIMDKLKLLEEYEKERKEKKKRLEKIEMEIQMLNEKINK